jgi:hypothetical protein
MRTPELAAGTAVIVVVDDGSPRVAETRGIVSKWKSTLPIVYVEHGTNKGIPSAWNTCSRAVDATYVTLLNDDVIVSGAKGGWLAPVIHPLRTGPNVGGVGVNWHAFLPEDVPQLLASRASDLEVVPREPVSKQPNPGRRDLEGCNPGRVMCPTGQLFAFRRSDFDRLNGFDERFTSFYEESDFGTAMASIGKIGVQLNWPQCYHLWSATFAANPELNAGGRIAASRELYRRKWNVPGGVHEFEYTNPKYMGAIGDVEFEWLRNDGSVERGKLRTDGAYIKISGGLT